MRAGELDCRITLQRATESRDALNNVKHTWTTLATVWASRRELSGNEGVAAGERASDVTRLFQVYWCRKLSDLNSKDRLIWAGATHNIIMAIPIGRREGIAITATARGD